MESYIGLGFLVQLEFLSIGHGESDVCDDLYDAERQIDQAICYLRNLKGLRLDCIRTDYTYLSYLKELRYLDILQTSPINTGRENIDNCQSLIGRVIPTLTQLHHLALPKFLEDHSFLFSHKQTLLTCLYVTRPINTHNLPNLHNYRMFLKDKYLDDDHRNIENNLPKKGVTLTLQAYEPMSTNLLSKASDYYSIMERVGVKVGTGCCMCCTNTILSYVETLSPPLPREMVFTYLDTLGSHYINSSDIYSHLTHLAHLETQ
jgi:hypothetical protein